MKDEIEKPTVGRVVLYTPRQGVTCAAIVANTFDDYVINLMAVNPDGSPAGVQMVQHVSTTPNNKPPYWDWMAYQKSQAAKTAQLQAELDNKTAQTSPEHWTRQPPHDAPYKLQPGESAELSENGDMGKLQAGSPSPVDGKR